MCYKLWQKRRLEGLCKIRGSQSSLFSAKNLKKNFRNCFSKLFKIRKFQIPKNGPQTNADNILRILAAKQNWKKRVFLRFSWCQIFDFRWKVIISALKPWTDLEKIDILVVSSTRNFNENVCQVLSNFDIIHPLCDTMQGTKIFFFSFLQINGSPTGKFWWLKQI